MSYTQPTATTAHSPSPSCESPSPSTSTSALPDQPPRKRSRSEMSSEERKEARAHRNRIAAQNSRDRRKAQFGWLERRVAELEEENRRLRAGLPTIPPPPPAYVPPANLIPLLTHPGMVPSPQVLPVLSAAEDAQRAAQDRERERENEELKERIRTLERGWDAVVKALQQQGLPTGLPSPTVVSSTPSAITAHPSPVSPTQPSPSSPSNSSILPTVTPSSASQLSTSFPSPAPSHLSSSSDFDSAPAPASDDSVSARHLAAGGNSILSGHSAQAVSSTVAVYPSPAVTYIDDSDDDDARMEDLFREILVEDTSALTSTSPLVGSVQAPAASAAVSSSTQVVDQLESKGEEGSGLGKRKREGDDDVSEVDVKKVSTATNENEESLSFDGLDMSSAGLDFTFGWTDPATTASASVPPPLSPEELQQMLHQFEVGSTLFPNDLGLEVGAAMDLALPLDLGTWGSTAMTGVF